MDPMKYIYENFPVLGAVIAMMTALIGFMVYIARVLWAELRVYLDEQRKNQVEDRGVMFDIYNRIVDRLENSVSSIVPEVRDGNSNLSQRLDRIEQKSSENAEKIYSILAHQSAAIDATLKLLVNNWKEKIQTGPLDESKIRKK